MLAFLALGGCASQRVTLFGGEAGHPTGALAVFDSKGGEQVLDQPLSEARLSGGGASIHTLARARPADQKVLDGLPPPPSAPFVLPFATGQMNIGPDARPVLDEIRAEMARRPGAEVQVTGHTDTVGNDDDNDRLSLARAESVVNDLVAAGFSRDQLSAVGRGKRELKVQTPDNTPNAENRRVEVIVR
jgi:outer membrane protein OmpA-like peptidoglycan-associated protein